MKENVGNVGIITKPIISKGALIPVSNLAKIIVNFSSSVHIITGNEGKNLFNMCKEVRVHTIKYSLKKNIFFKIISYLYMQLKLSFILFKYREKIDICIFFLDAHSLLLPVVTAKLLQKKILFALTSSLTNSAKAQNDIFLPILGFIERVNYPLADQLILYSPNLVDDWNLTKYKDKISIANEHFVNLTLFRINKQICERDNLVGYIGRLSEEKGIINFIKAIPIIVKSKPDVNFLIGGDGLLRDEIVKYLHNNSLSSRVKFVGWIPHEELPSYLNDLKLVVIPSFSEGLPNVMLEAMASGSPLLANSVGSIPYFIRDGENGFLMQDNFPDCIAENVLRSLNSNKLDEVSKNARKYIESEFNYTKAVEKYFNIITKNNNSKVSNDISIEI
ncbi:glycosyltransferase family 4 protein [Methanosarcina sp.]|uniref:glycosyltransferase family 4 protein n=1 Tax=Methanosarcina sp. TaxID=2213 RepID=UPI003BB519CD